MLEYRREMAMARSAGVLLFRITASVRVEVLLGHMGGPFHARRDDGAWSIPKGEYDADKDPRAPGVSRRCGIGFALAPRLLLSEGAECTMGPQGEAREHQGFAVVQGGGRDRRALGWRGGAERAMVVDPGTRY